MTALRLHVARNAHAIATNARAVPSGEDETSPHAMVAMPGAESLPVPSTHGLLAT